MRNCLVKMLGLLAYFFSSLLMANSSTDNLVAVGCYANFKMNTLPWIITSQDQGKNWTYFSKLPMTFLEGKLYKVSCNSEVCIAVGAQWFNMTGNSLVAVSRDPDKKLWSTVSIKPTDFVGSKDDSISVDCNTKLCAIASSYYNRKDQNVPLISISKDKGLTWIQPDLTRQLPEDFDDLINFNTISCTNSACVAAGFYRNKNDQVKVLIATSLDEGNTWSFHTEKLPSEFTCLSNHSQVVMKCSDSLCAAGVSYYAEHGDRSFILTSSDKGITWSANNIPSTIEDAISQVNCHDNTCILSGLIDYSDNFVPVLAVTKDSGKSWNYPKVQNLPAGKISEMRSVGFSGDNLIAGGFIRGKSSFDNAPALAISKDNGVTWSYHSAIKPLNFMFGLITDVSCNKNNCMATGYYFTFTSRILPYLIMSYDRGQTWSFPPSVHLKLPINFLSYGLLNDASSGEKSEVFKI